MIAMIVIFEGLRFDENTDRNIRGRRFLLKFFENLFIEKLSVSKKVDQGNFSRKFISIKIFLTFSESRSSHKKLAYRKHKKGFYKSMQSSQNDSFTSSIVSSMSTPMWPSLLFNLPIKLSIEQWPHLCEGRQKQRVTYLVSVFHLNKLTLTVEF